MKKHVELCVHRALHLEEEVEHVLTHLVAHLLDRKDDIHLGYARDVAARRAEHGRSPRAHGALGAYRTRGGVRGSNEVEAGVHLPSRLHGGQVESRLRQRRTGGVVLDAPQSSLVQFEAQLALREQPPLPRASLAGASTPHPQRRVCEGREVRRLRVVADGGVQALVGLVVAFIGELDIAHHTHVCAAIAHSYSHVHGARSGRRRVRCCARVWSCAVRRGFAYDRGA